MQRIIACLLVVPWLYSLPFDSLAGKLEEPLNSLQSPGKEWSVKKKYKKTGSEVEFFIKDKKPALNISARVFKAIPYRIQTYLQEVRKEMGKDARYRGAIMDEIRPEKVGDTHWEYFVIKEEPTLYQELWARKLGGDDILLVLYTSLGVYYRHYHPVFENVLQQVSD